MIRIFTGKPRGGKSYLALKDVYEELTQGNRVIVTNLALKLPELNALIQKRHPEVDVDLFTRVRILTREETAQFWLYHAVGEQTPGVSKEEEKLGIFPDFNPRHEKHPYGALFVIDEAHIYYDARAWMEVGRTLSFYCSQHAKLNDEIIFVTQHLDQLEKRLRNLCFEFKICQNMGLRRLLTFFRLPKKFKVETMYKVPGPIDHVAIYSLDPELANCYDTSAGVGITGRKTPERQDFKGLHIAWLGVPILGALLLLYWIPEWITKGIVKMTSSKAIGDAIAQGSGVKRTPVSQDTGVPGAAIAPHIGRDPAEGVDLRRAAPGRPGNPPPRQQPVWIVGSVVHGDKFNLLLSDGRSFSEEDAGHMRATRTYVEIDGERIWWKVPGTSSSSEVKTIEKKSLTTSPADPSPAPVVVADDMQDQGAWVVGPDGISRLREKPTLTPPGAR